MRLKTFSKWHVITGGPSSGKTTIVLTLEQLGYNVGHEIARMVVDEAVAKGISIEDLRNNDAEFQHEILLRNIEREMGLRNDKEVFLDRAVPDSIAYYTICGLDTAKIKAYAADKYSDVFFLEQLRFKKDYSRSKMEDSVMIQRLNDLLYTSYTKLGYNVTRVPAMPVQSRVDFILSKVKRE